METLIVETGNHIPLRLKLEVKEDPLNYLRLLFKPY